VKRVTLLADDAQGRPDLGGERSWRLDLTGGAGSLYIHASHVLSVEDADGRDFAPLDPSAAAVIADLRVKLQAALDHANEVVAPVRRAMELLAQPVEAESAPAQDEAPRVLTTVELASLSVGSVVDATVTGARVRAVRRAGGAWFMSEFLDNSWSALSRDLEDAVLVTSAAIQPAPVAVLPLPTEPGARFWGRSHAHPVQQWWFVRHVADVSGRARYVPSVGYSVLAVDVDVSGLVRLPDPSAPEATS
jgi:hypothetical protein